MGNTTIPLSIRIQGTRIRRALDGSPRGSGARDSTRQGFRGLAGGSLPTGGMHNSWLGRLKRGSRACGINPQCRAITDGPRDQYLTRTNRQVPVVWRHAINNRNPANRCKPLQFPQQLRAEDMPTISEPGTPTCPQIAHVNKDT